MDQARQRLLQNMEQYGLCKEGQFKRSSFDSRVIPVIGDLSKERLGLDPAMWSHLAKSCDIILHNGSLVNFLLPYPGEMRQANALGTAEALRIAFAQRPPKPFFYVSTLSVFPGTEVGTPLRFDENDFLENPEALKSGYAKCE
jgi:thioester reductase-like protein